MRISIPFLASWLAIATLVAGASSATEEQTAGASSATEEQTEAGAASGGSVERSAVTSLVFDREPQDALEEVASDRGKVFYFTEVRDMPGEQVVHRWEHDGAVMAEVPVAIGGTRWRTYSSKDIDPSGLGRWSVSTVDASGRVLDTREFTVVEATREDAAPPAAPAP